MIAPEQPSAQFYTPDDVQAALVADAAYRGISCVVEQFNFDPEQHRGQPRVWIDYVEARLVEPSGRTNPGANWNVPGQPNTIASAILDDAQTFEITIHAPPVGSGEGAAKAARRATDKLLRATFAALRRALGSPFREPVKVRWPREIEGYEGYVRGSLAVCEVVLASAILDDPYGVITVTEASGTVQIQYPDGTLTDPEAA